MTDADRTPSWLVRWLAAGFLIAVIAGTGYWIYWELTLPDRVEAEMRQSSCELARRTARFERDATKAADLASTARLVCLGP